MDPVTLGVVPEPGTNMMWNTKYSPMSGFGGFGMMGMMGFGCYTVHILRDSQIVGMLSVNGYTRQVFVHTWHGDLLEMVEDIQS